MTNDIVFTDMEKDVIGEVMNISLGSSATSLSSLLGRRVDITIPRVNVVTAGSFNFEGLEPAMGVEIKYVSGLDGVNLMILKRSDTKAIVEIMMGQEIPDEEFQMDELCISAICEAMNQMMGSAATALADFLGKPVNISTPVAYEIEDKAEFKNKYFNDSDAVVAVSFNLNIENAVDSEFINAMPLHFAKEIVSMFLKGTGMGMDEDVIIPIADEDVYDEIKQEPEKAPVEKPKEARKQAKHEEYEEEYEDEDDEEEEIIVRKKKKKPQNKAKEKNQQPVSVRPMEYENFDDYEEDLTEEQIANLNLIMSVPLEISIEIGRAKKQIKDILEFSQGTIVELDKQAGALVDIIVNGKMIAKGEVVVINDNFGVRVSEILKKDEIMKITL